MSTWALLLLFLAGGEADGDKKKTLKDYEYDLHMELIFGGGRYYARSRPVEIKDKTTFVTLQMIMENVFIDEFSDLITVNCWMASKWTDEYHKWDPSRFGGLKQSQIESSNIWSPELFLYNADMMLQDKQTHYVDKCTIQSNGTVVCIPHLSHTALCTPDPTRWPHDTLNCTLQFVSWVYTSQELEFIFADTPISTSYYQENQEWTLASTNAWKSFDTNPVSSKMYPSINFGLSLKRTNALHSAIVITPSIAMIILTIASGLLAPGGLRISVGLMSLMAQIIYMMEISHIVPSHGEIPANIIKFFRDSIIMTTLTIFVTITMMALTKFTFSPPRIVGTVIDFTKTGPAKYFTFGNLDTEYLEPIVEEEEESVSSKPVVDKTANMEWMTFSNIFNNVFFIITSFVYILLTSIYLS